MEAAIRQLAHELERLDLLLHREIVRLRARYQLTLEEFRGLYISDQMVDDLLHRAEPPIDIPELSAKAESLRLRNEGLCELQPGWSGFVAEFGLSSLERELAVLALAPQLDPKYENVYGYLNNDVTRKCATRDLARRLFSGYGPQEVDRALAPDATLLRTGLLVPALGGSSFQSNPILSEFVLAGTVPVSAPLRRESGEGSARDAERIARAAPLLRSGAVIMMEEAGGADQLDAVRLLCAQAGLRLLVLDASDMRLEPDSMAAFSKSVALQVRLERAALHIENGDSWFDGESRPHPAALQFIRGLDRVPLCCAGIPSHSSEIFGGARVVTLALPPMPVSERIGLWKEAVASRQIFVESEAVCALAQQFAFSAGDIAASVRDAADIVSLDEVPPGEALFAAARSHSSRGLSRLAPKVATKYRWSDLVLPAATLAQVKGVADAIRNRGLVFEEWHMSPGVGAAGLNILLSGASGTGKTMSAAIIAAESGLDLYRIDLSAVVSKYIGETEKNLNRIFTAARKSNAILFFDEADALFGKRSEVQDAHDRWANIEVAYLLQKLEEHCGVVILASNLSGNIDEAFSRRMQFHVEFPLPAEAHREKLWRGMFPPEAPLAPGVDLLFVARQFQLTGGQIRTISVDAAFLAAANGRVITMPLIVKAVARHLIKEGRMPSAHEFREYFGHVTETG